MEVELIGLTRYLKSYNVTIAYEQFVLSKLKQYVLQPQNKHAFSLSSDTVYVFLDFQERTKHQ